MNKKHIAIALTTALYSQMSFAGPLETLAEYNLVVLNDLTSTSEVDGKTLVGGNVSGPASNYGIHLSNYGITTGNALVVGGNISQGTTINANGYGVLVGGTNLGLINGINTPASDLLDFNVVQSEFSELSGYLSELTSNSTLSTSTNGQPAPGKLNIGSDVNGGTAVFNIDENDLFGNNLIQQLEVTNAQSASTVVINVSGETINTNQLGNFVGDLSNKSFYENVIWNFYEATNIDLNKQFNGTLLAPLANLTSSAEINGNVVAYNYTQNSEVHYVLFDGDLDFSSSVTTPGPVSVPAPAGLGILAAAFIGFFAWRRKYSKNA